jgi:release factor glutamine methyltransferase
MAEKLQTISDISCHISGMLKRLWSPAEAAALASAIITEYTGMGRAAQMAFGDRQPEHATLELILAAARRASEGEPLQYITGYTEFCGHRIGVEPGVLIPRPETEEMALMIIGENKGYRGTVTDLCTGSGCIAIALSLAFPGATVVATDISPTALRVAAKNISVTGAPVTITGSDIFSNDLSSIPVSGIIVSNPPYVTESEKRAMHANVLEHEPHEALFVPDSDPLVFYRRIAEIASARLASGGTLWLEVNENLAPETAGLLDSDIYRKVHIMKDIRGKKRFIKAERND